MAAEVDFSPRDLFKQGAEAVLTPHTFGLRFLSHDAFLRFLWAAFVQA